MVDTALRPTSVADLAEVIRGTPKLHIVGRNGHADWRLDEGGDAAILDVSGLSGVVLVEPADQVAVVLAGTRISEVQAELARAGQTLPYAPFEENDDPTIGGALSLGLPHRLEGTCGTWRDWTLGMKVVRANGVIAQCGSHAVKNVAGYDVGRLFIGARGALGVIAEVILRTYPLKALPEASSHPLNAPPGPRWVQRTPLLHAAELSGGSVDPSTSTLWAALSSDRVLPRFEGDWVVRSGCGPNNLGDLANPALLARAKAIFDPTGKLNKGAFGV